MIDDDILYNVCEPMADDHMPAWSNSRSNQSLEVQKKKLVPPNEEPIMNTPDSNPGPVRL